MTNHEDRKRVFLSSPHLSGLEQEYVANAFATNWVTPLGPHVDAFEREFAAEVGARHAVALSSGPQRCTWLCCSPALVRGTK
jgi:pyridoxal phosphate-dependent aminotransferase EpsN